MTKRSAWGISGFFLAAVVLVGCGKTDDTTKGSDKGKEVVKKDDKKGDDTKHTGWWCDEHGVPEAECSMCSAKVHKAAQDKGELCPKHPDRAKSQCFICDPKLKEKYNAMYKAKYGKDMPEPDGQKEEKKDEKKDGK